MNKLKELRTEAGLTQAELAERMGTSKQYISQLETGLRDIKQIRTDTMMRLCDVLRCTPEDLIVNTTFNYDDEGRLIVDKIFTDPSYASGYIVSIDGEYFALNSGALYTIGVTSDKPTGDLLKPIKKAPTEKADEIAQHHYVLLNCVPKDGFDLGIGRAITAQEFKAFKDKYNLTESDISDEFVVVKGSFYGKKYEKSFTVVQVKIALNAIPAETELQTKGIEAYSGAPERVNIRIK